MLNTCKDIISVDDDGCSNPFDECSNPFVGGGVVVVICWLHSCMHARRMLLLPLKVQTKPTKVRHEVRTLDTSFKNRNTQKNTHTHTHTQNLLRTFILCRSGFLYKSCGSRKICQPQLNCQPNQSKTGRGMNYIISESKAVVFQAKNSSCLKDGVWWGSRPGGAACNKDNNNTATTSSVWISVVSTQYI